MMLGVPPRSTDSVPGRTVRSVARRRGADPVGAPTGDGGLPDEPCAPHTNEWVNEESPG